MKGGIIHDSDLVSHSHQKLCKAKKRKSGKIFWSGEVSLGQGRGQRLPCIPIVRYRRLPPLPSVAILNHRSQRHQPRSTPSKVEPSTDLNPRQGSTGWLGFDDGCPGIDQLAAGFDGLQSMRNRPAAASDVPCLAGRLHHSCRSFSHVCDTLAAAPRHLTLCAVPCLVSSVQFSACLVTSPTFVLFVLLFCQQIETKNKLIAILVWRRTYQEAEDHRTKKLLRKIQSTITSSTAKQTSLPLLYRP